MTKEETIWWVNHLFEIRKEEYFNKGMMEDVKEVEEAQHIAIEALQFAEHFDLLKEFQSLQEVVWCNDCRYQVHCYQTVSHNKVHDGFKEYWSEPIDFCSRGERRKE